MPLEKIRNVFTNQISMKLFLSISIITFAHVVVWTVDLSRKSNRCENQTALVQGYCQS